MVCLSVFGLETLQAPIDLSLVVEGGRAFHVSWRPNPLNQGLAVGYKIAWEHPSRISHTAVDSVPASATHYLISPVDLSSKYTVLVWAYLMEGDGVPAQVSWLPQSKLASLHCTNHHFSFIPRF